MDLILEEPKLLSDLKSENFYCDYYSKLIDYEFQIKNKLELAKEELINHLNIIEADISITSGSHRINNDSNYIKTPSINITLQFKEKYKGLLDITCFFYKEKFEKLYDFKSSDIGLKEEEFFEKINFLQIIKEKLNKIGDTLLEDYFFNINKLESICNDIKKSEFLRETFFTLLNYKKEIKIIEKVFPAQIQKENINKENFYYFIKKYFNKGDSNKDRYFLYHCNYFFHSDTIEFYDVNISIADLNSKPIFFIANEEMTFNEFLVYLNKNIHYYNDQILTKSIFNSISTYDFVDYTDIENILNKESISLKIKDF